MLRARLKSNTAHTRAGVGSILGDRGHMGTPRFAPYTNIGGGHNLTPHHNNYGTPIRSLEARRFYMRILTEFFDGDFFDDESGEDVFRYVEKLRTLTP